MMIPNSALAQISKVDEILIATHVPLQDELWRALVTRQSQRRITDVLIPRVFDANYVRQLIEVGFKVYEAVPPEGDAIYLDRRLGFRLPVWEALSDPFARACKLAWSRIGYYTCLHDTVISITDSRLMKVQERDHLWFNVRAVEPLPEIGERLTILANWPFLDSGTPLLDVVTIWREENGSG
jgi:hypothetical protein